MTQDFDAYGASDYAGIKSGGVKFYYGYEKHAPDDDCDWCFVATVHGLQYSVPFSQLGLNERDRFECRNVLMHGIAYLIAHGILNVALNPEQAKTI